MNKKILIPFRSSLIKEVLEGGGDIQSPRDFSYGTYNLLAENENIQYIVEEKGKTDTLKKKLLLMREKPFSKIIKLGKPLELYYEHKAEFADVDSVLCINDAISFAMLHCKKKGFIKSRVITLFQSLSERYKYFKKFGFAKKMVADLLGYSDKILVLSSDAKQALIDHYSIEPERIVVFYFGIDDDFWSYKKYDFLEKEYVLTIGNDLNRDYRTFEAAVNQTYPAVAITKKRLHNSFIVKKNNLSFDEVKEAYYKARLVVIPVEKVKTESSGLSCTLQAMACGTPVLIADSPPMRELFVENEEIVYYEPGNSEDLAKKIKMLWDNRDLLEKISQNAYQKIQNRFNYKNMEKQVAHILQLEP